MYLNPIIGTGIFLSMMLTAATFSSTASASAATSSNNSTQPNLSIIVKTIQSAKNNAGTALSAMEGGTQCGITCIKVEADKLHLIQAQLQMVLMMLGNFSKSG
jgi:hypothetical protein